MKYKVSIKGFYYIEADSPEEAEKKAFDGDVIYSEESIDSIKEADEFIVLDD